MIKITKLVLPLLAALSLFVSSTSFAQPVDSLRLMLYVIETTGVPEREGDRPAFMQAHLAHQVDLEKRGIMFGAGPLYGESTNDGPPLAGMIIVRASSFEEAREIADADPLHVEGIRTYSIRRWSLNEGTFNVRVNFSDTSVEFE